MSRETPSQLSSSPEDPWERVVAFEEIAFREGANEARLDARERNAEGRRAGFVKGFEVGFEASFIEAALADSAPTQTQILSDHEARRRRRILERLRRLPGENDPDCDFSAVMSEVRALYSSCSGSVGTMMRSKPQSTNW